MEGGSSLRLVDEGEIVADDFLEADFDEIEDDLCGRSIGVGDVGLFSRDAISEQQLVAVHFQFVRSIGYLLTYATVALAVFIVQVIRWIQIPVSS